MFAIIYFEIICDETVTLELLMGAAVGYHPIFRGQTLYLVRRSENIDVEL
jgi:hypothetical protein